MINQALINSYAKAGICPVIRHLKNNKVLIAASNMLAVIMLFRCLSIFVGRAQALLSWLESNLADVLPIELAEPNRRSLELLLLDPHNWQL